MEDVYSIVPEVDCFSHEEAMEVYLHALGILHAGTFVIDLRQAIDATTSGFARLVLLRKLLRAEGRELRVVNLRERVAQLYQINRLGDVLPHFDRSN